MDFNKPEPPAKKICVQNVQAQKMVFQTLQNKKVVFLKNIKAVDNKHPHSENVASENVNNVVTQITPAAPLKINTSTNDHTVQNFIYNRPVNLTQRQQNIPPGIKNVQTLRKINLNALPHQFSNQMVINPQMITNNTNRAPVIQLIPQVYEKGQIELSSELSLASGIESSENLTSQNLTSFPSESDKIPSCQATTSAMNMVENSPIVITQNENQQSGGNTFLLQDVDVEYIPDISTEINCNCICCRQNSLKFKSLEDEMAKLCNLMKQQEVKFETKLDAILRACNISFDTKNSFDFKIPIDSLDQLDQWNNKLDENEAFNYSVLILKKYRPSKLSETSSKNQRYVNSGLSKLFSDSVLCMLNWDGVQNKKSMNKMIFFNKMLFQAWKESFPLMEQYVAQIRLEIQAAHKRNQKRNKKPKDTI